MRVKILIDDVIGRFTKGEIGIVLKNDFKKYDYFIALEPLEATDNPSPFIQKGDRIPRNFYFYKNEVEIIHEQGFLKKT